MASDVIFCFDTEDFTCNYAADAIRDIANILRGEGVKGNFCMVGLLAEQLHNWGRADVLEALSHHEIQYHSYGHTLHPLINEYTDKDDFDAAYRELMRREGEGLAMVKRYLNVDRVYAAVPPGNSKSYVAMYAYADMGIPVYADTVIDSPDGGMYFCNALHLQYMTSLEGMFYHGSHTADEIAEWFAMRKRSIIYTHPNRVLYSEFWDALNYKKENLYPFGEWIEGAREPFCNVEAYYRGLRGLIRRLKNDGRFCFKTISEVVREECGKPERVVTRRDLPAIFAALKAGPAPICSPCSLSIADVFCAAVAFLRGEAAFRPGKVYGFLDTPRGVSQACSVGRDAVVQAAQKFDLDTFLPESIDLNGVEIGPFDYLMAALELLIDDCDMIAVQPKAQVPCLDAYPELRDAAFKGTWMHGDDFEDRFISKRLRLQAWTLRNV